MCHVAATEALRLLRLSFDGRIPQIRTQQYPIFGEFYTIAIATKYYLLLIPRPFLVATFRVKRILCDIHPPSLGAY